MASWFYLEYLYISNGCVLYQNSPDNFSFKMTYKVSVWCLLSVLQQIPTVLLYYYYLLKNVLKNALP